MSILNEFRLWMLAAAIMLPMLTATAQPTASDTTAVQKNELSIDLQFLTRGESRYGGLHTDNVFLAEDENEDGNAAQSNFVMARTRLAINYKRDWLEARFTPQHSGVWGQSGKGVLNLYETWVKLNARNGLFVQVGRVGLSYDDERIIGSDDWAMASQSHDVLRLGYEGHGHKVHVILAYNQNADVVNDGGSYYVGGAQPYKTMQDIWYHYDFPRLPLGASLLFMNIGMQGDEIVGYKSMFQHLLGGYASFAPKRWKTELSYYHQFGKNESGMKIDAWMASAKASFTPAPNYGFTVGYDYLSGDKNFAVPPKGSIGMVRHEVLKGFSTVYGAHHKFYGAMDFFYVSTYLNGFTPGLQNAFIGAFYKPIKGLRIDASYHSLATATKLTDLDMFLGHEFELQASYNISPDIRLMAGASLMSGSKTMERLKRDTSKNTLRWGWISLSVNPRIFSKKW